MKLTKIIIANLLLLAGLNAKIAWREDGLGFNSGSRGSGIHWYSGRFFNDSYGLTFEARLFDLKGEYEIPVYDPYTGYSTTTGGISLVMVTCELGGQYFPFAGKIANNFAPFLSLQLGPNIVLDAPESGKFFERWGKAETLVTVSGFAGGGIAFYTSPRSVFSVAAGYDLLALPTVVDGKKNYSGLLLKFTFSRRR